MIMTYFICAISEILEILEIFIFGIFFTMINQLPFDLVGPLTKIVMYLYS